MNKSIIETEKGREEGTYYFRKHNGIKYQLLEGTTIGRKGAKQFASDQVFVMLANYDDLPVVFVGWMFGACLFDDIEDEDFIKDREYLIEELDHITDEWEEVNKELVQEILDGDYKEI